ncbi:hypothetical protein CAPTEDRAFT_193749 [Capitella teleta]|uniref:Uncharacterized protein n=1 Tax=Capitella teleta TaxID=283909 RepID=R7VHV4_CAPTE|nr:hypothetical protein CAPTEDRAFT_193749 [Capitella teleta]|eukprot:ELU15275.1 hypothetical protein CAPTEDRAFT_193749 [Capitella teleta]
MTGIVCMCVMVYDGYKSCLRHRSWFLPSCMYIAQLKMGLIAEYNILPLDILDLELDPGPVETNLDQCGVHQCQGNPDFPSLLPSSSEGCSLLLSCYTRKDETGNDRFLWKSFVGNLVEESVLVILDAVLHTMLNTQLKSPMLPVVDIGICGA